MEEKEKIEEQESTEVKESVEVMDVDGTKKIEVPNVDEKKKTKKNSVILMFAIIGGLAFMLFALAAIFLLPGFLEGNNTTKKAGSDAKGVKSSYRMSGNSLEDFDLAFLKLENKGSNEIYSPLSIKYTLAMLSEASSGTTKNQIDAIIGEYKSKKYVNSDHMSFANAMFIRNTFKDSVKDSYTNALADKYNAEVKLDDFSNASNMNNWVSQKTFNLINNLLDDQTVSQENFELINALAIDMNWNNQIQCASGSQVPCTPYSVRYAHEKYKTDSTYNKSIVRIYDESGFYPLTFNGQQNVKSAEIAASFNRYDLVKTIGEDKIREEVGNAYKEWLTTKEASYYTDDTYFPKDVNKYLDRYISEIKENYNKEDSSTDFMLYTDDSVKVFAKNLKEYDGTTLQYVGIMPVNEELSTYVEKVDAKELNKIISNLKDMKKENFTDGVVTLVRGRIPMFKYDYTLDLMNDLQTLGIKDAFDINKADLSGMLKESEKQYISSAKHKANIEFSNDGIKAAAATQVGGAGATGGGFDYFYQIPVEEIDLTFDKPFMYIIRDKDTGEVWFMGTVYQGQERTVPYDANDWRLSENGQKAWDNYQ